jgi:ABC-type sugar transport system ATPase subunit
MGKKESGRSLCKINCRRKMSLLSVHNISYQSGEADAVKSVHFTQAEYENVVIAGETGSGKTTLLKMIAGLVQPSSGEVFFFNQKVKGPNDQLIPGHPGIAYLSQDFELRHHYYVYEVLEYANKLANKKAESIYKVCQVDHLLKRRTDQLSGGERQRVALARLLTTSPGLLLLDEPFSNLDALHKQTIKQVIDEVSATLKITCIIVSHDANDILPWAHKVLVLRDGELVQQGKPASIYEQPVNEYVAALFGDYQLLDPELFHYGVNDNKGKKLLVRPWQLKIVNSSNKALPGTVERILYLGSYSIVEVLAAGQLLRVQTMNHHLCKGNDVFVALDIMEPWFL